MKSQPALVPTIILAVALSACERQAAPPIVYSPQPTVTDLIATLRASDGTFKDVPFTEVIHAATGKQVLPLDRGSEADAEIVAAIREAMTQTLDRMNHPESLTNQESRINECSAHFEEAIRHFINAQPGIGCDLPRTADGDLQRAGYPDLRILHEASGRVAYLDPKLVEQGSLDSSLRTFYYTPAEQTGKVLEDAHHLLVGIEHDGNTGKWQFLRWHLVDLSGFQVRLKAEFQADNRDIYRQEQILDSGEAPPKPASGKKRSETEKNE